MNGGRKLLLRCLLSLLLISGLASLVGSTIAGMSASMVNGSNSFNSGSLVLQTQVGATVCLSTGAGPDTTTNSSSCAADLLGASGQKPGAPPVTQTVIVTNNGTIDATSILLWSVTCSSVNAGGETYHGGGNICASIDLTVYDQTHATCRYPQTSGSCSLTAGRTLANWTSLYGSQGAALSVGALGAQATTTFVFTSQMEATAPSTVEGMAARIDFDWYLGQ
jgi:hypothetical protein